MSSVSAVLCTQHGPPSVSLKLTTVPTPTPSPHEVVICVEACGVNFPDTLIVQGKYQFQPPLPFAPGGEVCGTIKQLGSAVKQYKVGDRVVAMIGWGGFSEEIAVPVSKVIPLPESMDAVIGSAFAMTYGTTYHAFLDRGQLKPGETVLVLGAAGGVGIAAIELAKLMGAKVIAGASSDEKLKICKQYGADFVVNYSEKNWDQKVKEYAKNGVDVVYDPVGGEYAEKSVRLMAWEGRYLVIGFASGVIPSIKFNLYLLKGCSIVGVFWGRFGALHPQKNSQQLRQLAEWHKQGKIKPLVSQILPLSDAAKALEALQQRKVQGKVVLVTKYYKKQAKL